NLKILQQFEVNGESKGGATVTMALADLTPEAWQQVRPGAEPASPSAWAARAVLNLAEGRVKAAGQALEKCPEQALQPLLKKIVEQALDDERETLAAAAWEKLKARAKGNPSQDLAKKLVPDFALFEKDFGATRLGQQSAPERAALLEDLSKIASGWDKAIGELFKGKINSWNRQTSELNIAYDFSDPAQKEDFGDSHWYKVNYGCLLM